jgi:hypothetical protein
VGGRRGGQSGGRGGRGGEMTQALYAHMNNKTIKKKVKTYFKKKKKKRLAHPQPFCF